METVTVTKTSEIPSMMPAPDESNVFVILKFAGRYLKVKDMPEIKIYPNSGSTEYLTESDFTDFKINTLTNGIFDTAYDLKTVAGWNEARV